MLDANILIRAVLGKRARGLIEIHAATVDFFAPDIAFLDARRYLPDILGTRDIPVEPALNVLSALEHIVQALPEDYYLGYRTPSLHRISARAPEDWPVVACALALNCPIWTEDADFFGSGVATWTTDRVEYYLEA